MSRKKTSVAEWDATIADLQKQMEEAKAKRAVAMKDSMSSVGEIAIDAFADMSVDKKACKDYFIALKTLVKRHADEFQALLSGKGDSTQRVSTPQANTASVRLPNNAASIPAPAPAEASVDAEAGE